MTWLAFGILGLAFIFHQVPGAFAIFAISSLLIILGEFIKGMIE